MAHAERLPAPPPDAPLPRVIRDALLPRERGDFDREYRQVMAEATESLDLNPVIGMLERWRRVAVSAQDAPAHQRMLDRAERLASGQDVPTEDWQSTHLRVEGEDMDDDERQIRELIERWATAVHTGDLDVVLADHAEDIVMFDVPPPYEGVRGLSAYAETWPPFFEWQASGAVFELQSLDVVVGDTAAYAYGLLRCGTPQELAVRPQLRLRLTLGLRKEHGRWIVAHEHHSFADDSVDD